MRTIASLLFVLALAANAPATTVILERDGVAVPDGQVCRFAADDRDNPFKRWLMATEVTCVPSSSNVTFPSGLWNVFARIDGQAIGAPRIIDGPRSPSTLKFALSEAAAITTELPPDRRGFFYAPRLAYAIPAEARTTVPAGEELWLFVVENEKKEGKLEVLSLLSIPAVEVGTARPLQPRPGATSNVLGWVHVPAELRATVRKLRTPPKVFGTIPTTRTVVDGDPTPATPLLHGSFVRVRGLQAGAVNLTLGGEGWLASGQGAAVAEAVTVVPAALVARPAGSLIVNWSRVKDLVFLNFTIAACERERRPPQLEIILSRCRTPMPNEGYDPSTCREVSRTPDDIRKPHGSFAINELAPGFYQAEMRYGLLPPVAGTATVVAQEQKALYVRADYDQLFGTVTRASKPIEASTLAFDGKTGAGATRPLLGSSFPPWLSQARRREADSKPQDPAERRKILEDRYRTFEASYQAVVRSLPQTDSTIEIAACKDDSRVTVLVDRPATRGERFDIVIPDNEIRFRVIDTYTQAPLAGAAIRYTVLSKSEPHTTVLTGTLWTAKEGDPIAVATTGEAIGTAKIASVPARKTTFAVSYPGYERQTLGPFTIVEGEKRRIEVQMVPLRGGQSRIGSPTAFVNGAVYWYTRDGVQSEVAELAPDGTFFTLGSHDSAETMAVISESHPLWVTHSPRLDGKRAVTVAFPELRPREFHVVVDDEDDSQPRYVGLVVGGLRIPQGAFAQHQSLNGERAVVHGSRPLQVLAVGETGPIDVLLGPPLNEVPTRWQGMDLFTLTKYQDVPRQRLGAESSGVVFDE
ncbi:MAG: carboxypeptidase-like regulatory domain-containing protein [Thermoanaerobaculia bacterium]